MTIYTLYVKIHRKTGLKYLGQTKQDPFKYPGSGTDWIPHLEEFGDDVATEILIQTTDKEERNRQGRYYSNLWHVVTAADDFGNKIWANRIPETGGGGCDPLITKKAMNRPDVKEKRKETDAKPEVRARRSAALTEVASRPETKQKRKESLKKFYDSETSKDRADRKNKMKNLMKDEEIRKSIAVSVSKSWENSREPRSGKNHFRYDFTIYSFIHDSGIEESCTRRDLLDKYPHLDAPNLHSLIVGRYKSHKGWRLQK